MAEADSLNQTTEAAPTSWSLPLFLTPEMKWPASFITFAIGSTLYLGSNHFHIFPPQLLPMSAVDQAVPFIPMTVWIYISEYLYFPAVYAHNRDATNLNKYLYAFFCLQFTSFLIFFLLPTTYPRDLFPLPQDLNWVTYHVFSILRVADSPANCCPSLHVSSVMLSAFIYLDEQREKFPYFMLWASAIAVSTLTTKQHYLVDVISGFAMALFFYWVFHRWMPYRRVELGGAQAKR